MYSNSSDSNNYCCRIDDNGKGNFMMNKELADILGSIGANVRYPYNVQTPTREHGTRERARQVNNAQVQSAQDYLDQYRKMIHDILKD